MSYEELSLEQLRKKLSEYENQKGLFEKEGTIVYVHDPESPTANFTKIAVGIDASMFLNGKEIKDYFPCQVTKFNKDIFSKMDQTGTPEFKVGDRVKVLCDATNFQISEETFPKGSSTKRSAIFANNNLLRISMIEKGNIAPVSNQPVVASDNSEYTVEGLQGTFIKGTVYKELPEGYSYDTASGMITKIPF